EDRKRFPGPVLTHQDKLTASPGCNGSGKSDNLRLRCTRFWDASSPIRVSSDRVCQSLKNPYNESPTQRNIAPPECALPEWTIPFL
ncbi:MAG: hypothetical protein VXZ15_01770, partial [Planctomycetota bacterium]|nr:hypothetical protein [Planctomycetota bacterium]